MVFTMVPREWVPSNSLVIGFTKIYNIYQISGTKATPRVGGLARGQLPEWNIQDTNVDYTRDKEGHLGIQSKVHF